MSQVSNGGIEGGELGIVGANYNYTSQIEPVYTVDAPLPREVRFLRKQTNVNLEINNPYLKQSYTGDNMELEFRLMNSGQQIAESFKVRGKLHSQTINTSVGSYIKNSLSLKQDSYQDAPTIVSVTPDNAVVNGVIYINGTNLEDIVAVRFQNDDAKEWYTFGGHSISVLVPPQAIDGPIEVETLGGIAVSPSFNVTTDVSTWNA